MKSQMITRKKSAFSKNKARKNNENLKCSYQLIEVYLFLTFLMIGQSWVQKTQCSLVVLHVTPQETALKSQNLVSLLGDAASQPAPTLPPATTQPPAELPDFLEAIGNHTVAVGRDAQLSCKISNLANFRTAWLRVEDKGILTIHNNVITRNYRIGLINDDDGKNFVLTIKNVQPSDKGGYMCQINSVPMKYAIGYLDVLTPPVFEDSSGGGFWTTTLAPGDPQAQVQASGAKVSVVEGGNATLSCRAQGHPAPTIVWRREDNEPILLNGPASEGVAKVEAASISLEQVSRLNSGAYLCIASNGVQPSASRRQELDVQFSPVVRLPQTELFARLNQAEVRLRCFVDLNPLGSYHWFKLTEAPHLHKVDDLTLIESGDELTNSDKHEINNVINKQPANSEKVEMVLTIRQVNRQDFAWYRCVARNSLGLQSNSIRLGEESRAGPFSLDGMFGSGGEQPDSTKDAPVDSDENNPTNARTNSRQQVGGPNSQAGSRTHTRSSWVQRNRLEPATPTKARLGDSASSSSSSSSLAKAPSVSLLLLFISLSLASCAALLLSPVG